MLKRVEFTALAAIVLLAGLAATAAVIGATPLALVATAGQLVAVGYLWSRPRSRASAEHRMTALQAAMSDVSDVILLDADRRIVFAGAGCQELLGVEPARMVGELLGELVHTGDTADYRNRILTMIASPPGTASRWQVRGTSDGGDHPLWLELSARTVHHDGQPFVLVMLRDATVAEELDPLVQDDLTGLVTRDEFFRQASRATSTVRPEHQAAILFCDLDGFDGVNDVYGRVAGDEVLRSVAARLRRALRPHELIGRIGGDEFGVLLPGPVERKDAEAVAARLQAAVATPITLRAGDLVAVPMDIVTAMVDQPTPHAENIMPQTYRTASRTLTPLP